MVTSGGQCTNADVSGFRYVNIELGCVLWYANYTYVSMYSQTEHRELCVSLDL